MISLAGPRRAGAKRQTEHRANCSFLWRMVAPKPISSPRSAKSCNPKHCQNRLRVAARSIGSRRKSLHRHDNSSLFGQRGPCELRHPMLDIAVAIEKAATRTAGTTTMDVGSWLQSLGLEKYERAFRENDVDAEVLAHLTADDLISIGVTSVGRRKLLAGHISAGADKSNRSEPVRQALTGRSSIACAALSSNCSRRTIRCSTRCASG
jgi:hypothetical protein